MCRKTMVSLAVLLVAAFCAFPQAEDRRTALVIGNSSYRSSPLKNPANDARDMSAALKELGFSVTTLVDANHETMFNAIRDFGKELTRGGIGLFYYAGHGMQAKGSNFLIPSGADIQSEDEIAFQAIDAGLVLSKMESAGNRVNIVILDACRDNPFARSFRSSSRGLSVVEAPRGSLVVYSTAPGAVAADGSGRNGIFTSALLKNIRTPGVDVELMLRKVRQEVMQQTTNGQVPWSSSSLTASFFFNPAAPTLKFEKTYGSLTVEVKAKGTLLLNGASIGEVAPGAIARIDNLEAGSVAVEVRYADGQRESRKGDVEKDSVLAIVFSHVERPKELDTMVLVQGGIFKMGDTFGDGDANERPVHPVIVSSFYLGKWEVTQREWQEIMGTAPSSFKGDDLPVESVSWFDAVSYCNKLSIKKGLSPCYTIKGTSVTCDFSKNGYRLPTEAEWEFAARGGGKSGSFEFSGSNSPASVAWNEGNAGGALHPVGQKLGNELGLFDLSGNVWEWCWDNFGPYSAASLTDPQGPSSGEDRVLRGGSWFIGEKAARVCLRGQAAPDIKYNDLGFRVVRSAR